MANGSSASRQVIVTPKEGSCNWSMPIFAFLLADLSSLQCDCSLIDGGMQKEFAGGWLLLTHWLPLENSLTCLLNFPFLSKLQVQINAGILFPSESAKHKKRWRILIVDEDREPQTAGGLPFSASLGKNALKISLHLCGEMKKFTLKWRPHTPKIALTQESMLGRGKKILKVVGSTFGKRSRGCPRQTPGSSQWAGKALAFPFTSTGFSPSDQTNVCFKQLLGKPGNGDEKENTKPSQFWLSCHSKSFPRAGLPSACSETRSSAHHTDLRGSVSSRLPTDMDPGPQPQGGCLRIYASPAWRLAWSRCPLSDGNAAPGEYLFMWENTRLCPEARLLSFPVSGPTLYHFSLLFHYSDPRCPIWQPLAWVTTEHLQCTASVKYTLDFRLSTRRRILLLITCWNDHILDILG